MSREEYVFSKKAMVVVAVLSVLGSVAMGGLMIGFRMNSIEGEITSKATLAATAAAVSAVQTVVVPVRESGVKHEALDDQRVADLKARIERIEERLDGRYSDRR
jgi:Tfp pilus assembly protein FimT